MLQASTRLVLKISEYQGKIFSFLILIAALQICYELFLRYFLNSPTAWGLELSIYLCATTYIMGGAYAARYDAHIRIDIFYAMWPKRVRALVDLFFANVFFFIFNGSLVWFSALWLWEAIEGNLTSGSAWSPPVWPMRLIILTGSSVLLLTGIIRLISDVFTVLGYEVENNYE
jgi:TRAP-type mannitol/chloroaromatic compound transport system permease small subunit